MAMVGDNAAGLTSVDHALDQVSTALDHLIKVVEDGGLEGYDNPSLVGFVQSFERCRNRLSLVDHRIIVEGDARRLPDAVSQPSMARVLVQLLRLSPAEASRRMRAAQACSEQVSPTGEILPAARPHLAAAQRAGEVSAEQVHLIGRALAKVDRAGFDPDDIDAGEQLLTHFARTFGSKDLQHLADRTIDAIDPDGTLPDDQLNTDRRHLTIRPCRDGMYAGEFRLTGPVGAKLTALLQPLTRPRLHTTSPDPGFRPAPVDERTYTQRTHDALEELCDRLLRSGDAPGSAGVPATVIVTVALSDLTGRLGCGTTSDGTPLSTRDVLQLARQAEIVPAVISDTGAVLDLGRTRRLATHTQTLALIARDHGCSFPGCDRPPQWCERHHILEWIHGGRTDLNNLTLLCRYHHHNFANRGWTCHINSDGLPEWRPPPWLDRTRQPLLNSRIAAQLPRRGRPTSPAKAGDPPQPPPGGQSVTRR